MDRNLHHLLYQCKFTIYYDKYFEGLGGEASTSIYCRCDSKALRIYSKGEMPERIGELQEKQLKIGLPVQTERSSKA